MAFWQNCQVLHWEASFEGSLAPVCITQPSHPATEQHCTSFRWSPVCWDPFQQYQGLGVQMSIQADRSECSQFSDSCNFQLSLELCIYSLWIAKVKWKSKAHRKADRNQLCIGVSVLRGGLHLLSCISASEPGVYPGTFRSLILYLWLLRNCLQNDPISNPKIINGASTVTCSFDVFVSKR